MKRPTREGVAPHLALAHGVEEELQIPKRAAECRKRVVSKQSRPGTIGALSAAWAAKELANAAMPINEIRNTR